MPGPSSNPNDGPRSPDLASTVYACLRSIAQRQMMGERPGQTLSATALVHEAYLRLGDSDLLRSSGPAAFYHAAAQAMRRILIDRARARGRIKRGGGAARVPFESIRDVVDLDSADQGDWAVAFDEAFRRLEEHDAAIAEVVRLRFFAGLTVPQTATALGISERTVNNRWAYSRAWMAREIDGELQG